MIIYLVGIFVNILLISIDQFTKYLAEVYLQPITSINIIPNVFDLHFLINRGAAFGLMQGGRWFFIVLTILILSTVVIYYIKLPKNKHEIWYRASLILISAGAIGNFIDRLRQGYVVDFFYFKLIDFPVFNFADIFIVVGTILFVILVLFFSEERSEGRSEEKSGEKSEKNDVEKNDIIQEDVN